MKSMWSANLCMIYSLNFSTGFTAYLLSEECDLFDTDHRIVCQDMSQPLTHYFVASSHNTWVQTTSGKMSTSGSSASGRNKYFR